MASPIPLPFSLPQFANYPMEDLALIERAFRFAEEAHGGQMRASGEPYLTHPAAAAETLAKLNLDAHTIAAALLHDVIDDTPVTIEEIEKEFGSEIAFLVNGVTKLGKLKYRGVERQVENLRKMFLAMAEDIRVVLIKLADRLHNMKTLSALPEHKRKRIALETMEIYAPLAGRLGIGDMKGQLEDLAFPYAYPDEYRWLMHEVQEQYRERQEYAERVKPVFEDYLRQDGIAPLDVHARAKHHWTLYQKLLKKDMDITKIHDLVALRVVVPEIQDCYAALGATHKHWRPLPGRIKDYIALPKPSGYQSIHTTVFCLEGKITEIQIRTPLMHEHAEHGIAAHWAWSEAGKPRSIDLGGRRDTKLAWVKQLREWQKEVRGTDDFLESLRIDFFRDRIFVFTPKGEVMDLPEGATPVDFAYHVHSAIGDQASGARVDGKYVALDTALQNGQVVEIITQRNRKASQRWLEFVKTNVARGHIRRSLRVQGIEVRAPAAKEKKITADLSLAVEDRIGLLRDISNVLTEHNVNIRSLTGEASDPPKPTVITAVIDLEDNRQLREIIPKLKAIPNVIDVHYKILQE